MAGSYAEDFDPEACEATLQNACEDDFEAVQSELRRVYRQLENRSREICQPSRNVALLAQTLSLGQAEMKLLDHLLLCERVRAYAEMLVCFGQLDFDQGCRLLSLLLDEPTTAVRSALARKSPLMAYSLIEMGHHRPDLQDFVQLDDNGRLLLGESFCDARSQMAQLVAPSRASTLECADFAYLGDQLGDLLHYLGTVSARAQKGVHILLHGAPGTGKTELARLIAEELGWQAYDVGNADQDGDPIKGGARFGRFALAQRFLARQPRSLLIFDEVEDVFPRESPSMMSMLSGERSRHGRAEAGKSWINELLEDASVPSIWIANEVSQIDPAYLRRFALVLEVPVPPVAVRARMLQKALGEVSLPAHFIGELAEDRLLTPALLQSVAAYSAIVAGSDPERLMATLRETLLQRKRAMGMAETLPALRTHPTTVSLEFLNLSGRVPAERILQGLQRHPAATICLYGPPGSAFSVLLLSAGELSRAARW